MAASANRSFYSEFPNSDRYIVLPFQKWAAERWTQTFYVVAVYLALIFGLKAWMKNRKPYDLRTPMLLWNVSLSSACFLGFFLGLYFYPSYLTKYGLHELICEPRHLYENNLALSLTIFYAALKFVELGDTVFVVLRKQKLIFLHWFHHVTVLLYGMFSIAEKAVPMMTFGYINVTVHSFMYLYYALKAAKVSVPRVISLSLTVLQILQMVAAIGVAAHCFWVKSSGRFCGVSDRMLTVSVTLYAAYFLLFANFFIKSYVTSSPRLSTMRTKSE